MTTEGWVMVFLAVPIIGTLWEMDNNIKRLSDRTARPRELNGDDKVLLALYEIGGRLDSVEAAIRAQNEPERVPKNLGDWLGKSSTEEKPE